MGSNFNSQTVNVPKPDLLSVMAEKGVPVNGCKFCRRTIFWNGAFWNHADGKAECEDGPHDLSETSWAERVEEEDAWDHSWPHWWGKHYRQKVIHRDWKCMACGETSSIWDFYSDCKAKVATPAGNQGEL
jgi:hypothetical protein